MSCVYYVIYLLHTISYRNNTGTTERMSMKPFFDFIVVMIYLLILYILAISPISSSVFRLYIELVLKNIHPNIFFNFMVRVVSNNKCKR